ncbi:MAG: fused MFS/spermidine synthase, partial [Planctomycetaceae bacterium]|nr:fused MFS/spermidine synthase [Planctomycetaceae bacterium]
YNPKLHLHFNDAREFLLTAKKQYDLIVSEPSNPYRAGIANLYTREFYQSVSSRLNQSGLFLQWVQGYEVDDRTVMIVLQTIRSVFPNIQIWRTKTGDMVLVCGKSAAAFPEDVASLRRNMKENTIREGLNRGWGVDDAEGVIAHYVCGNTTIDRLLSEGSYPLNQDDRNLLEYAFAKTVGKTVRFSIQDLHLRAVQTQDDSPVPADQLSQETIAQRRLAMYLFLGTVVPNEKHRSETQQLRADAFNLYLAKRYADAVARFQRMDIDFTSAIELTAYAHALAEAGESVPDRVMQTLNENNPTQAAAVQAIALFQQRQYDRAADQILTTFQLLQANPWGSSQLFDAVLQKSVALSDIDSSKALPIYKQLHQPFALYRLEDKRLLVRYVVSEQLEKIQIVEALKSLEPNVPWKGWLLESRAKIYAAAHHPLAAQAKSDLQRFKSWNR